MDPHTQRAEAERWLGIAAKLLTARDFLGSKTFAIRAREADPNNPVSDQILAVVDTVLAGEKRVNSNQQPDWYGVLQLPRLIRDADLIADHYRRLVLCLNPERNRFPFADYALQLVMDAWSVLSDPSKKWLFDNELALYLQQGEQQSQQPQQPPVQQTQPPPQQPVVAGGGGGAAAAGGQLNTFQFFQPQPQQPPQQQQQQAQQQQQMWQQQMQAQPQQTQQQQQQQQISQREFISLQSQPPPQQVPPQWQMRDPTVAKGGGGGGGGGGAGGGGGGGGGGERNKEIFNGVGNTSGGSQVTQTVRPVARDMTQTTAPAAAAGQPPVSMARVAASTTVRGGGGGGMEGSPGYGSGTTISFNNNNSVSDFNENDGNLNGVGAGNSNNVATEGVNVENNEEEDVVVEEEDCFWTACPYCFYIFEYLKMYQDCALKCQVCKRGFHAVQIPNPPPISALSRGGAKGGNDKGKEKEKGNSFCCWGFYPLGFSMGAWKKHKQTGNSSSWVPFSPMFNCPVGDGGEGFKWFDNADGNAFVGPKNSGKKNVSWVYIDDDGLADESEPSDLDSSDGDWRTASYKKKKRKRVSFSGVKRGRPPKNSGGLKPTRATTHNVASGGGVSVGGEEMDEGSDAQEVVVGLAAGDKSNAKKTVSAALARKLSRRSVKDVGRLDLNVEFNNEGEDHAATVSAVNGEEDVIENIAFFEGLDEFLSTLPILNAGGDEKAKPS